MAYIRADGSVGTPSLMRRITDFFRAIFTMIGLFFASISNPNSVKQHARSQNRTYAMRHQGRSARPGGGSGGTGQTLGRGGNGGSNGRGANIRGVRDLGSADCKLGG